MEPTLNKLDDSVKQRPRRLILWCLPRTSSTTLAKCLTHLDDDTEVWFEPFNSSRIVQIRGSKAQKGFQLPKEYEGNEAIFGFVAENVKKRYSESSPGVTVLPHLLSYGGIKKDLETSKHQTVIVKEMAVASYGCYDYIPSGFHHILLIRDPYRVIPSMRKLTMEFQKNAPENADLEEIHATYPTLHWFGEMYELWKHLKTTIEPNPLIIDTEDFLSDPASYLKKICETIGAEYRDDLLQWDSSQDVMQKRWKHAFIGANMESVLETAGFGKALKSSCFIPTSSPKPTSSDLTPDCARIVGKCVDYYDEMYKHRFIPST